MAGITATELELLDCFGVEPVLAKPDKPWCHTDSTYSVELDGVGMSFTVHPSYRDVRLIARAETRAVPCTSFVL